MESFEILKELGLTGNEAKAYQSLLERGNLGAAEVSKFSRVPSSRIYDVLASLEQKGFIKLIPEKTKKFAPSDPEQLNDILEKKQESLNKIKENIKDLKKMYDIKIKNPVILGQGKPAFYKILKEMGAGKKRDYSVKWSSEYRPEWEVKFREEVKRGVDNRVLARYDKETADSIKKWIKVGRKKVRKFENKGAVISIVDNDVLITLITKNCTLLIRDEAFADIISKMFLAAYNGAEEIK
jgi:sugar-specific transcriptional regulator TrmB